MDGASAAQSSSRGDEPCSCGLKLIQVCKSRNASSKSNEIVSRCSKRHCCECPVLVSQPFKSMTATDPQDKLSQRHKRNPAHPPRLRPPKHEWYRHRRRTSLLGEWVMGKDLHGRSSHVILAGLPTRVSRLLGSLWWGSYSTLPRCVGAGIISGTNTYPQMHGLARVTRYSSAVTRGQEEAINENLPDSRFQALSMGNRF